MSILGDNPRYSSALHREPSVYSAPSSIRAKPDVAISAIPARSVATREIESVPARCFQDRGFSFPVHSINSRPPSDFGRAT